MKVTLIATLVCLINGLKIQDITDMPNKNVVDDGVRELKFCAIMTIADISKGPTEGIYCKNEKFPDGIPF